MNKGHIFNQSLDAIVPDKNAKRERAEAVKNAEGILKKVFKAFRETYNVDPGGVVPETNSDSRPGSGLVYGKIQSGKTRAMILTTALALDNGFKIVVVLTTHINRLVDQTMDDFVKGLPSARVYSKTDLKSANVALELPHIKKILQRGTENGIVIVTSKGPRPLTDIISFFEQIDAGKYAALILDDEGDQATLDTNTKARSLKGAPKEPSRTHSLIHHKETSSLRKALPVHVFVSVTGTPQALVLQSIKIRPLFLELLEPGKDYIGGDTFFQEPDPYKSPYVMLIDSEERFDLFKDDSHIPEGLKNAICFFVLAATAAGLKDGWKSYKFLCHPSVKQTHHETVARLVISFIGEISDALNNPQDEKSKLILLRFEKQYKELKKTVSTLDEMERLLDEALKLIDYRKVQILNARTSSEKISYNAHYNFLIGGNTIGRGIAIKKLLVTYYVREAKTTQMDTMYQHSRMFGYRKDTLKYTRVFLPPQLYNRFRHINDSDEDLRQFIKENGIEKALTYFVKTDLAAGLRPTRSNILDANHIRTLLPGRQYYPDYPIFKKMEAVPMREKVLSKLASLYPDYEKDGKKGMEISTDVAGELLDMIKTKATNSWNDKQVSNYLRSASRCYEGKVLLKYREAPRRNPNDDYGLSQGILGASEWQQSKEEKMPVLWIFDVAKGTKKEWDGVEFIYPSIVLPSGMTPFVFNRT